MQLFIHKNDVESLIAQATSCFSGDSGETELNTITNIKRQLILSKLESMLQFAETNQNQMLQLMGYNSIEELNQAMRTYKNFNLSLSQIFPAFSEPQISEILMQSGIDKKNELTFDKYDLLIAAIEENMAKYYPDLITNGIINEELINEIQSQICNNDKVEAIAQSIAASVFGGMNIYIDLESGIINVGNENVKGGSNRDSKLKTLINKTAKINNFTGINDRTYQPFIRMITDFLINSSELLLNNEGTNRDILIKSIKEVKSRTKDMSDEIIKRMGRGGIKITSKVSGKGTATDDGGKIELYLDSLMVDINPNIFNISNRGKQSIEQYVNEECKKNSSLYNQLKLNITNFYWNKIINYLPQNINSPLTKEEFSSIIDHMTELEGGNIGWFFSQSSTKALGSGMFGEIAGMIYMKILCPKLKLGSTLKWAGGVTEGAKPPADVIIEDIFGKQYGLQIKNYTSGTSLSAGYKAMLNSILENGQIAAENNKDIDLMTLQASSELGINVDDIITIQNVIAANTFNISYRGNDGDFFPDEGNPNFKDVRNNLTQLYKIATLYMAYISVISHRLQYFDSINRQIDKNTFQEQLQNTLWLINGAFFVSSVQILEELKTFVLEEINRFFTVNTSVRINKENAKAYKLNEGKQTIVDYLNYNPNALNDKTNTYLKSLSVSIDTTYKMSAFNK